MEFRAGLEGLLLLGGYPLLKKLSPGSGPVLVIPGFTTSDNSTFFLRRFLGELGYDCHGWNQGVNSGLHQENFSQLGDRLMALSEQAGQPVALVGWNVGGFYARALAHEYVDCVKQVITLATPFALPSVQGVSRALNRLYRHINEDDSETGIMNHSDAWELPPPVPSTSIYSEGDGVANWRYCLDEPGLQTENVRIVGSHLGMTVNPLAYFVIADRLAEDSRNWHSFADKHRGKLVLQGFATGSA
jgi:pimeloyl-ACP methyl ester carboxylesterase